MLSTLPPDVLTETSLCFTALATFVCCDSCVVDCVVVPVDLVDLRGFGAIATAVFEAFVAIMGLFDSNTRGFGFIVILVVASVVVSGGASLLNVIRTRWLGVGMDTDFCLMGTAFLCGGCTASLLNVIRTRWLEVGMDTEFCLRLLDFSLCGRTLSSCLLVLRDCCRLRSSICRRAQCILQISAQNMSCSCM